MFPDGLHFKNYETLPAYFSKAFQKYKWLDNDLSHLSMLGKIFAQIKFQGT